MFTFLKCRDKQFGFEWWACRIKTPAEFGSFIQIRSKALVRKYFKLKEKIRNKNHIDWEESCIAQLLENNRKKLKTVVDDLGLLSDEILGSYTNFWLEGKILLINQVFGFGFLNDSIEVLETVTKKEYIFPDQWSKDNIRIIKWTQGKHYYAKIGNQDVVIDDIQKWKTRKQAYKKALEFLEIKK